MSILCRAAVLLILFCSAVSSSFSQSPKQLPAHRTTSAIIIDGKLDDAAWKTAPLATDFVELRPVAFRKETHENRTEVYLLYDDAGIYFGGFCHERSRDSVQTDLAGRDNLGSSDFIGIVFDTYNDKINGFEYFVTPLNEQMDAKQTPPSGNGNDEDFSWNAVWKSGTEIRNDGWTFEFFIPYSAIRFSKKPKQDWGLNIVRRRQQLGRQLFWNPIDPIKNGFMPQEGFWTGIEDIKPPVRLSLSPYFSTYLNNYPYNTPGIKNTTTSVNGGMDVKYGISQAYTLDMTLIPDFGQVQSDNQVLNLTPFEVKYNENRTFFTEGTELFSKGNLFYSRRVGGLPVHFGDIGTSLDSTEHIVKNPVESKLINATKISGRSKSGLGIGFFNALTQPQYALAEDGTGKQRKLMTDPLTNYNVFVLDQTFKHNSSVSFVNTNVMRNGSDYDANVSAAMFSFFDSKNRWNYYGKGYSSTLFNRYGDHKNITGYKYNLGFAKVSGHVNVQLESTLHDDKFDFNDLGYMTYTNYWEKYLYLGYNFTKPKKIFNRLYHNFNFYYTHRYKPFGYQSININYNMNGQLKNLWYVGLFANLYPVGNDFYEPRVTGRVFKSPFNSNIGTFFQTNYAKKFYVEGQYQFYFYDLKGWRQLQASSFEQYRFNSRISVSHSITLTPAANNIGFAGFGSNGSPDGPDVYFARRNRTTVENIVRTKYSFNNAMYITLRVRHYWSKVENKEFFLLNKDGSLGAANGYSADLNQNYNAFNVDMVYSWRFAPGSELSFVWKNAIGTFDRNIQSDYFKNLGGTVGAPQNNSISFRILYFFDYLQLHHPRNRTLNPSLQDHINQ
jgi:hypothetical protein